MRTWDYPGGGKQARRAQRLCMAPAASKQVWEGCCPHFYPAYRVGDNAAIHSKGAESNGFVSVTFLCRQQIIEQATQRLSTSARLTLEDAAAAVAACAFLQGHSSKQASLARNGHMAAASRCAVACHSSLVAVHEADLGAIRIWSHPSTAILSQQNGTQQYCKELGCETPRCPPSCLAPQSSHTSAALCIFKALIVAP